MVTNQQPASSFSSSNVPMDTTTSSPYVLLVQALSLISVSHYILLFVSFLVVFLYHFLEIHLLRDLLNGFRGDPVSLTFHPSSHLYHSVVSNCPLLHGRFRPTPWLSSPHLQTVYLSLFGKSPGFKYRRHIFLCNDGGTIALDWLLSSDVKEGPTVLSDTSVHNGKIPIMIIIPGLTSDSASAYVKHFAFEMAGRGWNVVVSNHRGLGGISITSDCFYNAGWTEDLRCVIEHVKHQYPESPLFAVGTSIGANVLVKYLGEDGPNTPLVGAASVCSPWDLLVCDRFINRRFAQKLYDRVLAVGLQGYAKLHHSILSRLVDWHGIEKSHSVRDFDNYATRVLGKFETVDTYYRRSSSVEHVPNVSLPLLCVSALDDPVCTREAIPWDECRANSNCVLATTQHGGHLAYYEGLTANSMWWVRAVAEFFQVLHSSSFAYNKKKIPETNFSIPAQTSIDQGPYLNITEDGMVTAMGDDQQVDVTANITRDNAGIVEDGEHAISNREENFTEDRIPHRESDTKQPSEHKISALLSPIKRRMDQLARYSRSSVWLLTYIAIVTTWPLVGSALLVFLRKKLKGIKPVSAGR